MVNDPLDIRIHRAHTTNSSCEDELNFRNLIRKEYKISQSLLFAVK